jgi:TP901 family phage tail tape measure protein
MTQLGNKMSGLGIAMTKNITLPIAAAGAIGYKAAAEIGKGYMLVARQLGYTGKELDRLMVRFRKVWRDVPEQSEVVAGVLINVEQRFNQSGKAADNMTKKVLDFSRIMGAEPIAVSRELGMWFQQNEVRGRKQTEAMDMLAYASQKSGISIDMLVSSLNSNSQMLQQLGYDTKEQIALFSSFESAGLKAEDTAMALRMAVAAASEEGFKTGEEGIRAFTKRIKEAPNEMEATRIAIEIFGRRAGPRLAAAIRQGTFSVDKWVDKLDKSEGTVEKTASATMQLSDRIKMLGKKILGLFEPIGKVFIYAFEDIILPALERAANFTDRWSDAMDNVPRPVLAVIGTMLTLVAVAGPLIAIISWLSNFAILKYGQIAAGIQGIYSFVFLKTAALSYAAGISMAAAFGWILVIIGAVAAAIYIVTKNWDKFAKVFQPVTESLKDLWETLRDVFGELFGILKPALIPALKKLSIIVGIVLLGAFGGLAIVLILIINIITAIIRVFVGLGKIIWGVSQIMRGFITGNRELMAEGVKNIEDGASDIGNGMKDMVMNSGRQIEAVTRAVAEGTMAMMDEFNKETAKQSYAGGRKSGQAFVEANQNEHEDGKKKRFRLFQDESRLQADEAGRAGKVHGEKYNESWEESLNKRGLGGALWIRGRREQQKREQKNEKDHQEFMAGMRQSYKRKDRTETEIHGGLIGQILRASHRRHTEEVRRGHEKQRTTVMGIQGGLIGWLAGVPAKQAFAMRNNSTPLVTSLTPAWNAHVSNTQGILLRLGSWLGGVPEYFKSVVAAQDHFIITIFSLPFQGAVGVVKLIINAFASGFLANIPRFFKNTILGGVRNMFEAGRSLAESMIKGFISRGRPGAEKSGQEAGKGFGRGLNKDTKKEAEKFSGGVINTIRKRLGIASPSTVFLEMGKNLREGLLEGLELEKIRETLEDSFKDLVEEDVEIWEEMPERIIKIFKDFNKWLATVPRMQARAMLSQKARWIPDCLIPEYAALTRNTQKQMLDLANWLKGWPRHAANLLKLNAHYMQDAGRVLASKLINAVKKRLGIASPSKEFEDIGRQMIMGLLRGLDFDQVMAIMSANFGGFENFSRKLFEFMDKHDPNWSFLNDYLNITNSQGLFNALRDKFAPPPMLGGPGGLGGSGFFQGVPLVPGQNLMRAVFNWLMAQVGGGHIISSQYRPGDPGFHGRGLAIDIAPGSDRIAQLSSQLIGGPPYSGGYILDTAFGELIWKTMAGGNHFNHVHLAIHGISPFLRQIAAPPPPPASQGGDPWSIVADVFSKGGLGGGQLAPLRELLMRESSMNPGAVNPSSGAWGLFQFMPFHHGGPYLPAGRNSTVAQQAQGGLRYIRERYGTPAAALAFHNRNNWYKGGGAVSATLHSGERVLTMQQNRWFSALARPLSAMVAGSRKLGYNDRAPVEAIIPNGTQFKIVDLHEGIVETIGESIDVYDENKNRNLRRQYRGK